MKPLTKIIFVAAILFALLSPARAQVQTYNTQPFYSGSTTTFSAGVTLGQTFTNVLAVHSMTYNFFLGTGGATSAVNLTAVFGQWDSASASFIGGTTVDFGTIPIPASEDWTETLNGVYPTFEYNFDLTNPDLLVEYPSLLDSVLGYETSASSVYALMLTNEGAATNLALGQSNSPNAFTFGQAYQGGGPGDYFRDWTFSQINVVPAPVPEASTVAALLGAAFIAGLVGLRLRQRRQLTALPAAPAAA